MIEITYISNAGILIQYEKVRILVDALQDAGGYPFSGIPEEITDQMFCSDNHSMYNDIDFLVFTHNHPDHITPNLVEKYLKFNKIKRIIWPVYWSLNPTAYRLLVGGTFFAVKR